LEEMKIVNWRKIYHREQKHSLYIQGASGTFQRLNGRVSSEMVLGEPLSPDRHLRTSILLTVSGGTVLHRYVLPSASPTYRIVGLPARSEVEDCWWGDVREWARRGIWSMYSLETIHSTASQWINMIGEPTCVFPKKNISVVCVLLAHLTLSRRRGQHISTLPLRDWAACANSSCLARWPRRLACAE
jgi:hypothetical protein